MVSDVWCPDYRQELWPVIQRKEAVAKRYDVAAVYRAGWRLTFIFDSESKVVQKIIF